MISIDRFIPEKHFDVICSWWRDQKWPVVPLTHLSTSGIVVSYDGEMAAAGWVYKTDSAFSLFEWIVANPKIRREKRALAISALIETAKGLSAEFGFKTVFINAKNETLFKRLKDHGFIETDTGMKNLIFNLMGASNASSSTSP